MGELVVIHSPFYRDFSKWYSPLPFFGETGTPQRPWWCRRGTRTVLQAGRTSPTSPDTECSEGFDLDVSGCIWFDHETHMKFLAVCRRCLSITEGSWEFGELTFGCYFLGPLCMLASSFLAGWSRDGLPCWHKSDKLSGNRSSFTTRRRHQDLLFRSLVKMTLDGLGQQDAWRVICREHVWESLMIFCVEFRQILR